MKLKRGTGYACYCLRKSCLCSVYAPRIGWHADVEYDSVEHGISACLRDSQPNDSNPRSSQGSHSNRRVLGLHLRLLRTVLPGDLTSDEVSVSEHRQGALRLPGLSSGRER